MENKEVSNKVSNAESPDWTIEWQNGWGSEPVAEEEAQNKLTIALEEFKTAMERRKISLIEKGNEIKKLKENEARHIKLIEQHINEKLDLERESYIQKQTNQELQEQLTKANDQINILEDQQKELTRLLGLERSKVYNCLEKAEHIRKKIRLVAVNEVDKLKDKIFDTITN